MDKKLDVLFVNPDSSFQAYQGLSEKYTAIEPPTWALLLAQSCRAKGFGVAILDCGAEHLSVDEAVKRIDDMKPRLVCFVMYGQNPNSGTASMAGAELLGEALKHEFPEYPTCFVGSHVSALPREVLALDCVDIVLLNEGVYALHNLLRTDLEKSSFFTVRGIGFKTGGASILNPPEQVVPQERMDEDLPGYAWDLLPYREKPLDMYRAHIWHAGFNQNNRSPFAAIYTSLGCQFRCNFCMINIVNRNNNGDDISAADSPGMRFWSPGFIAGELEKLSKMGVRTVRISDEMFFLQRKYFEPLLNFVVERELGLRMWAYARVDSVQSRYLDLFKRAGIDWLALGVESGNQNVRKEVSKGTFKDVNIREVVKTVRDHDINVIANYIFGLPEDSVGTMQETLELAMELNTEEANMYPCMALPGSSLYVEAKKKGIVLPDSYAGFGFLSYHCQPMPTKHCTSAEVLRFRDEAWDIYHSNPAFLSLVEKRFGLEQRKTIEGLLGFHLKRKILGDLTPGG
ncbi:MAG: radical SAM protein [Candidatus Paceibacterota bacterium]